VERGGAVGAEVTGEAECGGGGSGEGNLRNLARSRDRGRVRRSVHWMVVKVLREVHGGTNLFSASWVLWSLSSSFSNLCQTCEFGFWLCLDRNRLMSENLGLLFLYEPPIVVVAS
jgi:hypothetical protein